ncbi:hypothetical protein NDU88_001680 [Pleurodeles waltl]|uniref:Uncharacterized protein n=1 Tax=Pleurodeles waltl TaxID=8319 RepID=A0AAV7UAY9_PLEWA|nr:hypothetical protein NDU88_001680 [Pleurodeles waltl]
MTWVGPAHGRRPSTHPLQPRDGRKHLQIDVSSTCSRWSCKEVQTCTEVDSVWCMVRGVWDVPDHGEAPTHEEVSSPEKMRSSSAVHKVESTAKQHGRV